CQGLWSKGTLSRGLLSLKGNGGLCEKPWQKRKASGKNPGGFGFVCSKVGSLLLPVGSELSPFVGLNCPHPRARVTRGDQGVHIADAGIAEAHLQAAGAEAVGNARTRARDFALGGRQL